MEVESSEANIDSKTNVTQTKISRSVIATVVEKVVLQVDGVAGLSHRFYDEMVEGITERFGQTYQPGISVKRKNGNIIIKIYIIASFHKSLLAIGKDVQDTVDSALALMLDLHDCEINVRIVGLETDRHETIGERTYEREV